MKFVSLISGGKDSLYSAMQAVKLGHELVCAANLAPEIDPLTGSSPLETDSYMYQSAGHEVVLAMADCLQVPFVRGYIRGKPVNQGLAYETTKGDEVEDMFLLLADVKRRFPQVEAVCCGAILSTYQRLRLENICQRLQLTSLCFLWQREQSALLQDMLEDDLKVIMVKVATIGLNPYKHLNKELGFLQNVLENIHEQYGVHVCGEGGEYETLTLDCPLFKKALILDKTDVVIHSDDAFSPVGLLVVREWHTELKEAEEEGNNQAASEACIGESGDASIYYVDEEKAMEFIAKLEDSRSTTPPIQQRALNISSNEDRDVSNQLHHSTTSVHISSDQVFISGVCTNSSLTCNSTVEDTVIQQTRETLTIVRNLLEKADCSMGDVCFVHLYLADMDHFGIINKEYSTFFSSHLPPSRSCIAAKLPPDTLILIDCWAVKGSREAMTGSGGEKAKSRHVLHVQSMSKWAPVCIGPYSQANGIMNDGLLLVAGQIGLVPETMTLIRPPNGSDISVELELDQALWNTGQVLQSLGASLGGGSNGGRPLMAVLYVNTSHDNNASLFTSARDERERAVQYDVLYEHCLKRCGAGGSYEGCAQWVDPLKSRKKTNKSKQKEGYGYGGYNMISVSSDEEEEEEEEDVPPTSLSRLNCFPLQIIAVPNLPKGAKVEFEVVTMPSDLQNKFSSDDTQAFVHRKFQYSPKIPYLVEPTQTDEKVNIESSVQQELELKKAHPCWFPHPLPSSQKQEREPHKNENGCFILNEARVHINMSTVTTALRLGFVSVLTPIKMNPFTHSDLSLIHVCTSLVQGIESILQDQVALGWWCVTHVRVFYKAIETITAASSPNSSHQSQWNISNISQYLTAQFKVLSPKYAKPALTIVPVSALPHYQGYDSNGGGASGQEKCQGVMVAQVHIVDSLKLDTDRWVLECEG